MRYRELRWLNPPALPRRTSAHSSRCCLCFQGFNPIHQDDTRFLLKIRKYQRSETRLAVSGEGCTPSSNSSSSPSGSSSSLPSSTISAARPCLGNGSEFQINYFSHMWISFTRDMCLRIIRRFFAKETKQTLSVFYHLFYNGFAWVTLEAFYYDSFQLRESGRNQGMSSTQFSIICACQD